MSIYNISHLFTGLNGLSDHYAHSKVELGINWLSKLGFESQEVVMIGDTVHDLEVAQAMGTDCILISLIIAQNDSLILMYRYAILLKL